MSVGAKHECQGGGEHECADEPWSQAGMPAAEQQWAPGGKKISARDAPQLQTPSQTGPGDTPCTPANIPPPASAARTHKAQPQSKHATTETG